MHVKIKAGAGSCSGTVAYLEKEDLTRFAGEKTHFFTAERDRVYPEDVVQALDANAGQLGKHEARYYELYVSPSADELAHLGNDPERLKAYVRTQVMPAYAEGFGARQGKALDASQLVWYAKVEEQRRYKGTDAEVRAGQAKSGALKPGLQGHVHILVSRKDAANKLKLSPLANERGGDGPSTARLNGRAVRRGFDRDAFKERCERGFDRQHGYERPLEQSFRYQLAQKAGTGLEVAALKAQAQRQARERAHAQVQSQQRALEQARAQDVQQRAAQQLGLGR